MTCRDCKKNIRRPHLLLEEYRCLYMGSETFINIFPKSSSYLSITNANHFIIHFLWYYSPARAMDSCGTTDQCGLWPPVALQTSAGYGLLWHYRPVRAMDSCGTTDQCGLWTPRPRGFLITYNDAPQSVGLLWTSDQLVAETSTWQHTQQTPMPLVVFEPTIAAGERP
jgi:hypothetical protein